MSDRIESYIDYWYNFIENNYIVRGLLNIILMILSTIIIINLFILILLIINILIYIIVPLNYIDRVIKNTYICNYLCNYKYNYNLLLLCISNC